MIKARKEFLTIGAEKCDSVSNITQNLKVVTKVKSDKSDAGAKINPPAHHITGFLQIRFDGKGGYRETRDSDQIFTKARRNSKGSKSKNFDWFQINRQRDDAEALLLAAGCDDFIVESLLAEDTRPRFTVHGDGAILILRGVNLNQGEEPDDMVSVRFWIERDLVIGVWSRRIFAVSDVIDSIERGNLPMSPAELISRICFRLADRAEPIIADLSEKMDALEEIAEKTSYSRSRKGLIEIRQSSSNFRRYLVPQRDALTTMAIEDLSWLDDRQSGRIREAAERITRLGEELDALKDRAMIAHDEILSERADRMNRTMLLLAAVTTIFLPLGLITGVLGINVGGMPGADNPAAFWIVCAGLGVLGVLAWLYVERSNMMD